MSEIYAQISRVMADIGHVSKDRKNEQQRYSFRGIEDFYQAAHPAMIKHGVFCAPSVLERDVYRFEKTNMDGKVTSWIHVSMRVEHRFYCADGSSVSVTTWGEGLDNSDKASNKAMSGAMKYALIELFCVPTADVEDADRTTPETGVDKRASVKIEAPPKAKSQVPPSLADYPPPIKQPDPPAVQNEIPMADCITPGQATNFMLTFKRALPNKKFEKDAEALCSDFLRSKGIFDVLGKPSKLAIKSDDFLAVRDEAEAFARSL